jgi:hypothetical protein
LLKVSEDASSSVAADETVSTTWAIEASKLSASALMVARLAASASFSLSFEEISRRRTSWAF